MAKNAKTKERKLLRSHSYVIKTEVQDGAGIVEHIISVLGNIDSHHDIIQKGAYVKTISETKRVKVLDNHRTDSSSRIVGRPLSLREVGVSELPAELLADYPDATGGLIAETRYNLKTQLGRDIFALVEAGDISEYSVGIILLQYHFEERKLENGQTHDVRIITEVQLLEYSTVIWGANSATRTLTDEVGTAEAIEDFHYLISKTDSESASDNEPPATDSDEPSNIGELLGDLNTSVLAIAHQAVLDNPELNSARQLEKTLASIFTERQMKQLSLGQQAQLIRIGF